MFQPRAAGPAGAPSPRDTNPIPHAVNHGAENFRPPRGPCEALPMRCFALVLLLCIACDDEAVAPGGPLDGSAEEPDAEVNTSGCFQHLECGSGMVCSNSACEAMFPRAYLLTLEHASIAATRPDGEDWDEDGKPDLVFALAINDLDEVGRTAVAPNTISPEYNHIFEPMLEEGDALSLILYVDDEEIERLALPNTSVLITNGGALGMGVGTVRQFSVKIRPSVN